MLLPWKESCLPPIFPVGRSPALHKNDGREGGKRAAPFCPTSGRLSSTGELGGIETSVQGTGGGWRK